MDTWQIWVAIGIVFFILEVFTPGFLSASIGAACFGAALASFFKVGLTAQLFSFSLTGVIFFFGAGPLVRKYLHPPGTSRATGTAALIGRAVQVTEKIENAKNRGRVQIGGDNWKAASESGEDIEAGATVSVKRIEGVTAYVELKQ